MPSFFRKKIFLIFLLALMVRLLFLGSAPWGFHNDEVDVGYVGKFIVLNGEDPSGNFLPLFFNKFGDFRPAGLFYLSGLSELIFGTNVFAVRLPTALFGALTVFPLSFLTKRLFGKENIALFAASVLAIFPWHIILSRSGHEAIIGYFFILLGFVFLLESQDQNKRRLLVWSIVAFAISYFFYHGTRILVPMLLITSFPIMRSKIVLKLGIVFLILTIVLLLSPIGRGRLSQVIFYKNPKAAAKLQELPFADKGNIAIARIFHNKAVVYSRELVANYLQYFSPDFLFLRGGYPERYATPETGLIYVVFALPLIIGIAFLLQGSQLGSLAIVWLLVSPLPAVLTYEDIPSVTRASFI